MKTLAVTLFFVCVVNWFAEPRTKSFNSAAGVPCVVVTGVLGFGMALSCDWGSYDAQSDALSFRRWQPKPSIQI